ncbi:unnamed protein product [Adineta ricciae]|uniref:G-protein coupled receptors family 1 profile domain-containing protein n=1 Tax=Adineta ricciae TaxID=249248 RepID=A0A815WG33_ADIRI|nr:unnamed protein product [Adineta ricciae]CAF1540385.1 unnamed protein product [Adineta ricciae]
MSFHIQTLLGDLYEINFNSLLCIPISYLFYVCVTLLYWSFVSQGFFRLSRIVYPNIQYLQSFFLYFILFFIELIFSSIILCPLLFWHCLAYFTNEYYCSIKFTNINAVLSFAFISYGSSLLLLSLIYLRIVIFLRRQPKNQSLIVKQRQHRDLAVFQRILLTVGLLVMIGIPTVVFVIIAQTTGQDYFLAFRVIWPFFSLSMMMTDILLVMFSPQLKVIIRSNRVVPSQTTTVNSIEQHHRANIPMNVF